MSDLDAAKAVGAYLTLARRMSYQQVAGRLGVEPGPVEREAMLAQLKDRRVAVAMRRWFAGEINLVEVE